MGSLKYSCLIVLIFELIIILEYSIISPCKLIQSILEKDSWSIMNWLLVII